jgi:acyl dehydratase
MPLDEIAGRTYGPSEPYEVGREKIREFADAIGDPNPVYRDPAAAKEHGHADVVAPPTFAMVVAFPVMQAMLDDLGLPLHEIMHADQKFAQSRPIGPGDRLTVTLTIDKARTMGGSNLIFTRTEVTTDTGEPVCTASATVVHRGEA